MTGRALGLLSDIVAPILGDESIDARAQAALELLIEDDGLPRALDDALTGLVMSVNEESLRMVQKFVIGSGIWEIGVVRFVELVLRLVDGLWISIPEAAFALVQVPRLERLSLTAPAQRLLDLADAVVEDAREGVMQIEDDTEFSDAILQFDRSFLMGR